MRRPRYVEEGITSQLPEMLPQLADTPPPNVEMFCVRQRKGRAYYRARRVTVPLWAFTRPKGEGYGLYYLAHELAHIAAGPAANHGPEFMRHFKRLCPPEYQHFELGYKPKSAKAAGISESQGTPTPFRMPGPRQAEFDF